MEIVNIKVRDLKPYEKNAKKHDQTQIDNVAESIKQFGIVQPIVVNKDNVVIIGHCRLEACKKLKYKEVPCVLADTLTDEQVKELRLLDNKLNESEWDLDLISEELADLDLSDFELDWGIEELEPEKEVEEDDFDVDSAIPDEPKAKYGDVYVLGEHRLMCGDSTNEEDVAKLMDGELADLVVTDPPYNVDYEGKTKDRLKIENDKQDDNSFLEFLTYAFKCMKNNLKDGGAFYIWHADTEGFNFRYACKLNDLQIRECLIWNKNAMVMGRQDYQWKHEPCLYGWKEGASHYFIDDRSLTTVMDFKKPLRADIHPTMKPIELFAYLIKNSSRKNDIVLDMFAGSGTTVIACEQLNRKARVMEFDPRYVDAIIKRWEDFTGKKAIKIN